MIDFRYHVVSLVSVFLALAVGIVLGAGPLNEGISTGITDQVRQLTQEKDQLRTERDQALAAGEAQDAWAEAVGPAVVDGRLAGRVVAVVELPGADSSQTDAAVEVLEQAGASVSARVTVQDEWTAAAQRAVRASTAAQLGAQLGAAPASSPAPAPTPDAGDDADTDDAAGVLAEALARALVVREPAQTVVTDPSAAALLPTLADAGFVEVEGEVTQRGTLAVLVGGAADPDATEAQAEADSAAWAALAQRFDAVAAGAVVAGPTEAADGAGAVAAVRADSAVAGQVSTVDDLDGAVGRVNVVLALREQLTGDAGQYGTGAGASAVTPPLPAAAP
ncbi:copper transporter [Kineococcus indalonis]|uniref:copper transporter n=1 Tax=Kineococcus indalonis TaxID=2696566 RepID=UPI00141256D4|nr:copper transporter [Kineococcus indalonis]NAZ88569.1 copper transporter [Kineococcus indalonis]